MNYLCRVGGELYLPEETNARNHAHYHIIDIYTPEISVQPQTKLLLPLRKLLAELESIKNELPYERVNLAWNDEGEPLVRLYEFVNDDVDFFVDGGGIQHRFERRSGKTLSNGDIVITETVQNLFGTVGKLELTYVGSPGVRFIDKSDFSVVYDYYANVTFLETEKLKRCLTKKLADFNPEILPKTQQLLVTHILTVLADGLPEYDNQTVALFSSYDILGCLLDNYNYCERCVDIANVDAAVKYLAEKQLLAVENGEYTIASDFVRCPKTHKNPRQFALFTIDN